MDNPSITTTNLSKRYRNKFALNELNVSIPSGQIVGLMGPNGSGKTTLLKILAGLITEYQGTAKIFGNTPGVETKSVVSYMPDTTMLPKHYTVEQCIRLFATFFADFSEAKATKMCKDFGFERNLKVKMMSKGMQEKLHIALIMSRNAKVYLLDEPMGGIDPLAREQILQSVLNNFSDDSTLLISTHLITDVEKIIDYALFINQGSVLLQGDADDLRAQHGCSIEALFKEQFSCL